MRDEEQHIRNLEQRMDIQDCLIASTPKDNPEKHKYIDEYISMQIEYFNETGDFYGRHHIVM